MSRFLKWLIEILDKALVVLVMLAVYLLITAFIGITIIEIFGRWIF